MTLDTYVADEFAVFDHAREVAENDMKLLPVGGFLIFAYTIVVLWKNNWAACKAHLSLAALLSIIIATLSGFGFVSTIGFKVSTVALAWLSEMHIPGESSCPNPTFPYPESGHRRRIRHRWNLSED